jgi:hypothetical protein
MDQAVPDVLVLEPADVSPPLSEWLATHDERPLLISVERLATGQVVLQSLPDVDPTLVARIRKVLAQHADVLRRLT